MINHNEATLLSHLEVAQVLATDPVNGLTSFEARERLKKYGSNRLDSDLEQSSKRVPKLIYKRILSYFHQFTNPLIQLLLICVLISFAIGEYENAVSVLVAILLVCTISYIQEYRADRSLEKLTRQLPNKCLVIRESKQEEISCDDLVPGDVILLQEGCRVPADVRLFDTHSITINESNLSGETQSQVKIDEEIGCRKKLNSALSGESTLKLEKNIIFQNLALMGTLVETGHSKGMVICTGCSTRYGQVFEMLKTTQQPKSPLQMNIDHLSMHLVMMAIFVIALTSIIGILQNRAPMEVVYYAISLAVTAIPEGLPVVVAVIMALGVVRLSKSQTIVKSLNSIETLGCFQVLCADKTGTLTRNEMNLTDIVTSELHSITISELEEMESDEFKRQITFNRFAGKMYSIGRLMEVATLCNNATVGDEICHKKDELNESQVKLPVRVQNDSFLGSSTECAILAASMKLGFGDSRTKYERLKEIPFDSKSRRMIVQCQRQDQVSNGPMYYVKGAWEDILSDCTHYSESGLVKVKNDEMWSQYGRIASSLGKQGLRVLALANGSSLSELTFVGLIGINNSPREGIVETLTKLSDDFKIDVKMITGDSKTTALSVGRTLGLLKGVEESDEDLFVMSGAEVDKLIHSEMDDSLKGSDIMARTIFYRVDPIQKANIISKLQEHDKVVAMTGDGINDVISLKRANLSVAMGSAADVCKEIADIVAVNDDLSVLVPALIEGKAIYQRVQSFLSYQISMSLSLLLMIGLGFALRFEPPFTVTQVLYINLLTDGPPAQALGFEVAQEEEMKKGPPRNVHEPLLNCKLIGIIFTLTSTMTLLNATLYLILVEDDGQLDVSSKSILFTCFVFSSIFAALSLRSKTKTIFELNPFANKELFYCCFGVFLMQVMVLNVNFVSSLFEIEAIPFLEILYLLLYASLVLASMDFIKICIRLIKCIFIKK